MAEHDNELIDWIIGLKRQLFTVLWNSISVDLLGFLGQMFLVICCVKGNNEW